MKRYRIEIFDKYLAFKCFAEAAEPDIQIDYLVQTNSKVECPGQIACARGDFAQIRIDGNVYFQGVITDWTFDGYSTEITIQQMSALLNLEVFADASDLNDGTKPIETWFGEQITSTFSGTDTYQNLTGLTVSASSSTTGSIEVNDNGIYNLYDLDVYFFKTYGVMIDINFDYSTQKTKFIFKEIGTTPVKLNLQVSDVESYDVEPSLSNDNPNKMIIRNDADNTQEITYYWHPTNFAGTVDTDASTNRVVPVVTKCETVNVGTGETFASASLAAAENTMYQTRFDDLITVTLRADSNLVTISSVGQQFTLYAEGNVYYTILTGMHAVNMKYIECTFGYVRKRLTQILRMKG